MPNMRAIDHHTRWAIYLKALTAYATEHGHTRVPGSATVRLDDGTVVKLGAWVSYIRQRHRRRLLDPSRAAQLDQLPGWEWGPLPPGPRTDTARDTHILELRRAGWSLGAIADQYNLSRQRVHQVVARGSR